ncbi:MAG: hypothetical protein H9893_09765 [Candidatus Niameybacter stercoravium]|nr:hypothetical protein [Candidatus Niameybacter stercoravium]
MNENTNLEAFYEKIEGDYRKLEELIMQLEVWSDTYTINHKKEEERLEEYMELSENLYNQEALIRENVEAHVEGEERIGYLSRLEERMLHYKETEAIIHNWVRDIRELHIMMMRSSILNGYRDEIEAIKNA